MDILLIHLGTPCECFIATSVIRGLRKTYPDNTIYCVVQNRECYQVFEYNRSIRKIYIIDHVPEEFKRKTFDLVINLHPNFSEITHFPISAKEKLGFNYTIEGIKAYNLLYINNRKINKSLFQIYYKLAHLTWAGEGFDFYYYPKAKAKKSTTGTAIINRNLKKYIVNRLHLDLSQVKDIPDHNNLFRRLDALNKCSDVITDDFFTLNLALYLRKGVFFLEAIPLNTQIELFGQGKVFPVPKEIVI